MGSPPRENLRDLGLPSMDLRINRRAFSNSQWNTWTTHLRRLRVEILNIYLICEDWWLGSEKSRCTKLKKKSDERLFFNKWLFELCWQSLLQIFMNPYLCCYGKIKSTTYNKELRCQQSVFISGCRLRCHFSSWWKPFVTALETYRCILDSYNYLLKIEKKVLKE